MVFVELSPSIAFRIEQWSDEDLHGLQNFLLATPDADDVIPGGSGLRKLRWAVSGRTHLPDFRVRLKSAQADLTHKQIKTLAQLIKDIDNG